MRAPAVGVPFCCLVVLVLAIAPGYGQTAKADEPAQKQPPKMVKFEMDNQPLSVVFRWLSDEAGKPVITSYRPTGMFTFKGPPEQEYTISDVVNLINEELLNENRTQKYYLAQRSRSFVLVAAEEMLQDCPRPRRVRPAELDLCSQDECVTMTLPLTRLDAEKILPIVRKNMGRWGEIIPIKRECAPDQFELTGTRDQLKGVLKLIRDLETNDSMK